MPARGRRPSQLAERRKTLGYSQEKFAEKLGVDRSTVARWERGETKDPQPEIRPLIAQTLGISLEELSAFLTPGRPGSPVEREPFPAALPGINNVTTISRPRDIADDENTPSADHDPFDIDRDGLILRGDVDAESQSNRITSAYISSIHHRIDSLLSFDHQMGGRQAAPLAMRAFKDVHRRLGDASIGECDEKDLYSAAGEIAEVAGWFLFEAAEHSLARQVNHEALEMTRFSGNRSIELLIMQNMAMHASHLGRPMEALRIARRVLELNGLSPRIEALFRFRESLSFAQVGRVSEARRALKRGVSLYFDGTSDTDPAWTWWIDDRQVSWYQGKVEWDLGERSRSIEHLGRAVQLTPPDQTRSLYFHLADLMRAQVHAGAWSDVEETANRITEFSGVIESGLVSEIFAQLFEHTKHNPEGATSITALLRDGLGFYDNPPN